MTRSKGNRRESVLSMSCTAAPVGEVTKPYGGELRQRALMGGSNSPSASARLRRKNS